ncbi:MAG: hypothetical protein IKI03_05445, partial [Clostridia bacterium]|nr:hypothetical protein [Clostridia bacterium]
MPDTAVRTKFALPCKLPEFNGSPASLSPSQVGVATCFGHCLAGTKIISGKTLRPGADDYTSR